MFSSTPVSVGGLGKGGEGVEGEGGRGQICKENKATWFPLASSGDGRHTLLGLSSAELRYILCLS